MLELVVTVPSWSGAEVVEVVSLLVPSELVVCWVVDEEPSWLSVVVVSVYTKEPSGLYSTEFVVVVVEPSWFSTTVCVSV